MNQARKHVVVMVGAWLAVVVLVLISLSGPAAAEGPMTLKWSHITARNNASTKLLWSELWAKLNEKVGDRLKVKWAGGPETIRRMDLGSATKDGIIDIATVAVGFYEPLVPGIGGAMLTQISLDEERKPGGAFDFMDSLHQKGGLKLIGRPTAMPEGWGYFRLWLNKKVEKPEDFKGLKLGTATVSRAAVPAWGSTPVNVGMQEYYPALERNVVDGIASCPVSFGTFIGLREVAKYLVDPGFYSGTLLIIMNLNTWNRIPKDLQDTLMQTVIEGEKSLLQKNQALRESQIKKITGEGLELLKLKPEFRQWFLKTAYDAAWDYQMKRFPEVTPKLRALLAP